MENINIQPSYMINKYGNTVTVMNGDNAIETKAFIQTLKRRHTTHMSKVEQALFEKAEANRNKLYIGHSNVPISTSSIIYYKDEPYKVLNTEEQIIGNKTLYIWAILEPTDNKKENA